MTSPLETKARALMRECWLDGHVTGADFAACLACLLAFASEVERETLEKAARADCDLCIPEQPDNAEVRPATFRDGAWWHFYRFTKGDSGGHWTRCKAAAIRSLSEPPAETPEPKG